MALPQFFTVSGGAVASYDWLDITSGVGYRRYYACISNISAGDIYFLTPRTIAGSPWRLEYNVNNQNYVNVADLDFNVTFKVPAIITGDAIINIMENVIAGTQIYTYYVINVYHVDAAAVETSIGTATSAEQTVNGNVQGIKECILVTLSNKKFAIGEKLRLNILFYAKRDAGANRSVWLNFDPAGLKTYSDEDGRTADTTCTFDVPFKISI